jgi:hypothetical protein
MAFALLVLVTLGCGASAQAAATEAPFEAPAKLPDMSIARIYRQQLPGGFREIPMDDVAQGSMLPGNDEYLPELVFGYINQNDFHLIIGMNFLLVDAFNRLGFKQAMKDPDTLKGLASALGGENLREVTTLETLDDLGEQRKAMSMLADVEGVPMRVNLAIFQRDVIGGIIVSMTEEGQQAKISFEKLGQLFDQRVQESLATAQ